MKRTAKYETRELNRGKWCALLTLANAYAAVKDESLRALGRSSMWHHLDNAKKFRDLMKTRLTSPLPVHLCDQAVFDAVDTMKRFIETGLAATHVKVKLFHHYEGAQRRYAFWLLKKYGRIDQVLRGYAPEPAFEISRDDRKEVVRFLRRTIRKALGTPPRVRARRSFAIEETLYRVFEHNGRQYVAVAGLERRQRIALPLRGRGRISGNVRVVLNPVRRTVSVHMPYTVRIPATPPAGPALALDAGVTEVFTSSDGRRHGDGFGKLLDRLTEDTTRKGRRRHKLHALARKYEAAGKHEKASNIRRFNLGRKKLQAVRDRSRSTVKTVIGAAARSALRNRPSMVITEDLSRMRGRTKNRKLSRIVSRWMRSTIRERVEFRTTAGGSRHEPVNAAYSSQTCPVSTCGFVHKGNRRGDRFYCLKCGWDGDADVAAAVNLLVRVDDPGIRLWTPKERVKAILDERFRRRKETGNLGLTQGNGTPLPAGLQQAALHAVPVCTEAHGAQARGRSAKNKRKACVSTGFSERICDKLGNKNNKGQAGLDKPGTDKPVRTTPTMDRPVRAGARFHGVKG